MLIELIILSATALTFALLIWFWNRNPGFILETARKAEKKYLKEFEEWIERCENIYKECKISGPLKIEASNKIGNTSFNTHRYSVYIPHIPEEKVETVAELIKIPENEKKTIIDDIWKNNREVIYGVDLSCDCGRIYLNRSSEEVLAYEWIGGRTKTKHYSVVTHDLMEGRLKESFSEQVIKNLKLCLPKQHWEHSCIKYDTREKTDRPCGFYLSSKYAPTLSQNYKNISSLIKEVYDGDSKDLDQWFEDYKNCTISWYVLTNKKGKVEISIYFNTSGRLMDFIENRMFDIKS